MRYTPEIVAALDALPPHPVFLCDLNAGVTALALRFDARDQSDRSFGSSEHGYPGNHNSVKMTALLNEAATQLGPLVDVTPLTAMFARDSGGPVHPGATDYLHDGLECLVALGCDPRHVVIDMNEADNLAIAQFLGAVHLALFGRLPIALDGKVVGCHDCARYRTCDGRPWSGEILAFAHTRTELSPNYRIPSRIERDAHCVEGGNPFFGVIGKAALRLAIRANEAVRALTPREIDAATHYSPELVAKARALGILRDTTSADVAATAMGGLN